MTHSRVTAAFLSTKEVGTLINLSRSQINKLKAKGRFPLPVKLGGSKNGYCIVEIEEWMQCRKDERRSQSVPTREKAAALRRLARREQQLRIQP